MQPLFLIGDSELFFLREVLIPHLLIAIMALLPQTLLAAANEPMNDSPGADRPRIGLVLGGGGARGSAHIGVLQELKRMRIPIDVIVGTSMGAVVGGLYASGMTPDELQELINTLDWKNALSDGGSRGDLSFRRKEDDEDFPIRFEVGIRNGKLQLPQGVIQGQQLDLVLRELTINASQIRDFDDLPIPFRAVASDLVTGEAYVMGDGDLALALRASMSVPGAFTPVDINGHLLVDGGLVGNLAISVMRELDVDVIIAVNVEFPLYSKDDLLSAVDISEQVLTILIRKETQRQIELLGSNDILIQPDLGTFASTNFLDTAETIEPGIEAAQAAADKLARYSVSEVEYEHFLAAQGALSMPDETIDFIMVKHDARVSPQLLERRMQLQVGDKVDVKALSTEANRLYGLQVFEKVGYQLVDEGDSLGVVFSATSKRWGPTFLRFGLAIEDDFEGSTSFNLATRIWRPAINELGAEWRSDIRLGTDPLVSSEFYQPLRMDSRIFVAPHINIGQGNIGAFEGEKNVARYRVSEASFGLDIGAEFGTYGEFRIGAYRGAGKARVKIGDPLAENFDFDLGGILSSFNIDTRDSARFPRSGTQGEVILDLSRASLGADRDYETAEFNFDSSFSRGRHTLTLGLQFGSALNTSSELQDYFALGGFLRMSGLERGQLRGPYAGLARVVYYGRIGSTAGALLEVPVYLGASVEAGNVWGSSEDVAVNDLLMNGSLFIGLDTYFGPVYLAAGLSEGGGTNFYLFVGATPR
ncbi:MAG TPA: patatin-like phospholipase family protein [Woeseiaceae bacterium]|nr:patatin-like phospholipase family protein [Woeseiaceae bacterium]